MNTKIRKYSKPAAIVVVVSILLFGFIGFPYWTAEEVRITVTEKERITTGSGENLSSKYLIFTSGEVFENTDCWRRGKFGSSDVQNALKEGGSYTVTVYGWRVPLFSMYRNIVKVD